ncbi:MAG TPA: hypothetical protein VGJ39_05540 [Vicinamibacterales bacterium]|jgi:hypothetical protein
MKREAPGRVELPATTRTMFMALAVIGLIAAAAGAFMAPARMWASWLMVAYYTLGLGLAGLCFVAIHYATGSTWSVAIRRVPEALAGTLPFSIAMLAILFLVHPQLYGWTTESVGEGSQRALAFKHLWLSRPFFLIRAAVYSGIWILFAFAIRRRSRRQDHDGDPRWTRENFRLSAGFLVLFAITVTLASIDWVMSIEFQWFSTIFGVYNFASLFFSGLAAIILLALWLERAGPLKGVLTEAHLHDLGKLLFAFSVFWAYIWFSQYMLIWYTNIPEETSYFVRRQHGAWFALFIANLFLNFVIPFCVLLRRDVKRQRQTMAVVAAIVLVGRWLDVYLMIFPGIVGESPTLGVWEIGLTLGGIGAFGLVLAAVLKGAPAVPVADPELVESLEYH